MRLAWVLLSALVTGSAVADEATERAWANNRARMADIDVACKKFYSDPALEASCRQDHDLVNRRCPCHGGHTKNRPDPDRRGERSPPHLPRYRERVQASAYGIFRSFRERAWHSASRIATVSENDANGDERIGRPLPSRSSAFDRWKDDFRQVRCQRRRREEEASGVGEAKLQGAVHPNMYSGRWWPTERSHSSGRSQFWKGKRKRGDHR